MKNIKLLLILTACTICATGCGKKKEIKSADLALALNSEVPFTEHLTEIDETTAIIRYGFDTKDCENIISFIGTQGTCDEFTIIKTGDKKAVKEKLGQYLSDKKAQYDKYRPEESLKLDSVIIEEYKNCVTMIVTSDTEKAMNIYGNYLKK